MVSPFSVSATTIEAVRVHSKIPVNPSHVFWSNYGPTKGKSVVLDLQPQMITNPMWPAPATKWVSVRAVSNGKEIAIRLEWVDPTRNDIMVQSQQYKDQAAVMFPVDPSGPVPPFTMGGEGERVNIWQWKATWNKEGAGTAGNEAMQDLEDQYDYMAMGSGSYYIYEPDGKLVLAPKQSPKVSERHTYIDPGMGKNEGVFNPGRATGNILSDNTLRRSPVEDLNAEGFSTLTTQSHQDVDGSGNWSNTRWMVVFKRSLKTEDPNDTQFMGKETPIAFAVWNGNNKERNGQKALTIFHILKY
jgi:DMSO reductase family type II enzyme heme b subunit